MAKKPVAKITDVTAEPNDGSSESVYDMALGEQLEVLDAALKEQQGSSLIGLLNDLARTRGVGVKLD